MNTKLIKKGCLLAALMNFSVIIFSKGFTNKAINEADPVVMSNFGLLMIVVWGVAYLASSEAAPKVKWIFSLFAIEKLVYVYSWIDWLSLNSLTKLYDIDLFAGIFFSIYGVNDFIFMIFFTVVSINLFQTKKL